MKLSTEKIGILLFPIVVAGCGQQAAREQQEMQEADKLSHAYLQGVWVDNTTEVPVFRIEGDTVYYPDALRAASYFEVKGDTFTTYGGQVTAYYMERLSDGYLTLRSSGGDLISLYKSDDDSYDSLTFAPADTDMEPVEPQVIEKDSVVVFDGTRFRGYVYINHSQIKVIRSGISQEGLSVDNVYYDKIIHICVYKGKQRLFSKDISKPMFGSVIPENFLKVSILEDMDFIGVNDEGYKYRATVGDPEGTACYYVDLLIDKAGNIEYKIKQ